MKNTLNNEFTSKFSYDVVPYVSYPFSQSTPERMFITARLFGMQPPNISTARVLELGCGEGANIIPHAERYPNASFVGIDLSEVAINNGNKVISDLGYSNITLEKASITDLDSSIGTFDYIICHGVYSWVPDDVRSKILAICNDNLSENGIAYISYNALPGWNNVATLRDLFFYHIGDIVDPSDKINKAREVLKFMVSAVQGSDAPYAEFLRTEEQHLSKARSDYFLHDHLSADNKAFYFHQFMDAADGVGLQYLGDATLSSMFAYDLPATVRKEIGKLGDQVQVEQYIDFIRNRRFRTTLLCHKGVALERGVNNEDFAQYALTSEIVPEKSSASEGDAAPARPAVFVGRNNAKQRIETPAKELAAALNVLAQSPSSPMTIDMIVSAVTQARPDLDADKVTAEVTKSLTALVTRGLLNLHLPVIPNPDSMRDKPEVLGVARYQASVMKQKTVTNMLHQNVKLEPFMLHAMQYMDGTRTQPQITDCLLADVSSGALKVSLAGKDNEPLAHEQAAEALQNLLGAVVTRLDRSALLSRADVTH